MKWLTQWTGKLECKEYLNIGFVKNDSEKLGEVGRGLCCPSLLLSLINYAIIHKMLIKFNVCNYNNIKLHTLNFTLINILGMIAF